MDAIDWNNKGIQYHNKRRYDEANDAYDRAIELDPDNPIFRNNKEKLFRDRDKPSNPEAVPVNKQKIFVTMMKIGELYPKYKEPEIQVLLNTYHLSNSRATKTAIKLFFLWIEMVEIHNFSKEELINLKLFLQDSEIDGLDPVIDKRLKDWSY